MSRKNRKRPGYESLGIEGQYNWHHRRPKILNGSGKLSSPNMVKVKVVKHRAWHTLFGTNTPQKIADIINETWLDNDWELIARRKDDGK